MQVRNLRSRTRRTSSLVSSATQNTAAPRVPTQKAAKPGTRNRSSEMHLGRDDPTTTPEQQIRRRDGHGQLLKRRSARADVRPVPALAPSHRPESYAARCRETAPPFPLLKRCPVPIHIAVPIEWCSAPRSLRHRDTAQFWYRSRRPKSHRWPSQASWGCWCGWCAARGPRCPFRGAFVSDGALAVAPDRRPGCASTGRPVDHQWWATSWVVPALKVRAALVGNVPGFYGSVLSTVCTGSGKPTTLNVFSWYNWNQSENINYTFTYQLSTRLQLII